MKNNVVAITMGDPAGIVPEIIVKSLAEGELAGAPAVVIGCAATMQRLITSGLVPQVKLNIINNINEAQFSVRYYQYH